MKKTVRYIFHLYKQSQTAETDRWRHHNTCFFIVNDVGIKVIAFVLHFSGSFIAGGIVFLFPVLWRWCILFRLVGGLCGNDWMLNNACIFIAFRST